MKFLSMSDVAAFNEVLDQCKNSVWMESENGSFYNMKSDLSRYVAIAEMIKNPNCGLELFASSQEDEAKLISFLTTLAA